MSNVQGNEISARSPRLILIGPSGSGKSVIAPRTAAYVGWDVFDTDDDVLARSGYDSITSIFQFEGESAFRQMELDCITRISMLDSPSVVATGGGMPAIHGAMDRLNTMGVTVYLKASIETLWSRLCMNPQRLAERPLLRDGGIDALVQMLDQRADQYNHAAIVMDTDQLTVDEVCVLLASNVKALMDTGTR